MRDVRIVNCCIAYFIKHTYTIMRGRLRSLRYIIVIVCLGVAAFYTFTHVRETRAKEALIRFRQERYFTAQNRPPRDGPGENGQSVKLTVEEQKKADTLFKNASFNVFASDKIAMDRSIPDFRREECRTKVYPKDLPTISVILIFNNEALSAILRTVHSVINRTPPEYLQEIVLLDDCSDHVELKEHLEIIVKNTWPDNIVKIVRRTERGGLVRARVSGAKAATGEALLIMDAHMEVNIGWAEPILARIKEQPDTIVLPVIDAIRDDDLRYMSGSETSIQGFTWSMYFWWMQAPQRLLDEQRDKTDPIKSFAMVGCVFAVQREYFFHIGAFDEGMGIWGGENVELPLRVWMCGGSVYQMPCSRIGHLYRKTHPFTFPQKDVMGHNSKRVAEVWLDDYKRLFYNIRPILKDRDVGDLSQRVALRERLNCHSFKWFLENIYIEKFVPDENVQAYGMVKNEVTGLCPDTLNAKMMGPWKLGLNTCQTGSFGANQRMSWSMLNEFRMEEKCFQSSGQEASLVSAVSCTGKKGIQEWHHEKESGRIIHVASGKCLDVDEKKPRGYVKVKTCNGSPEQMWKFEKYFI